jgi:hypothetical protein
MIFVKLHLSTINLNLKKMKKIILVILVVCLCSCNNNKEIEKEIEKLNKENSFILDEGSRMHLREMELIDYKAAKKIASGNINYPTTNEDNEITNIKKRRDSLDVVFSKNSNKISELKKGLK